MFALVHVFFKFALVHVFLTKNALVHVFLTKNVLVHVFLKCYCSCLLIICMGPSLCYGVLQVARPPLGTSKRVLTYYLMARFHGLRLATHKYVLTRDGISVKFQQQKGKGLTLLLHKNFVTKAPHMTELLRQLCEQDNCSWELFTSLDGFKTSARRCRVQCGTRSW